MKLSQSQIICETCFDSTREFVKFRTRLVQSQQALEDVSNHDEEIAIFNDEDSLEIKVEVEDNNDRTETQKIESVKDLYEEHLESDLVEYEIVALKLENLDSTSHEKRKLCSECGKTYSIAAFRRHYERVHLRLKNYHVSLRFQVCFSLHQRLSLSVITVTIKAIQSRI